MSLSLSVNAQGIFKDPGIGPDVCPVKDHLRMISNYFANAHLTTTDQAKNTEPYDEGCHTVKVIYISNLLGNLELNFGENKQCSFLRPTECTTFEGAPRIASSYQELVNYVKSTQKADVKKAIGNNEQNISAFIVNQIQHVALTRYAPGSPHAHLLAKANENIRLAFQGINLTLKGNEVDLEKTNACMEYGSCAFQMNDPSRATQRCKDLIKTPLPAFCSAGGTAANSAPVAAAAPVAPQLTEAQAQEYLNLNLDVKKAFETKPASDPRTKIQYASQHYHERSESEGRPRSVQEYLDCNPDVAYGFNDPSVNTNTDEAKTNITAFVAKHFQVLIQPIVPVSSRNFKTFGCINLEQYLTCYSDVKRHCSNVSNGDRDFTNAMKKCAFNHYRDHGKTEGRTGTNSCN